MGNKYIPLIDLSSCLHFSTWPDSTTTINFPLSRINHTVC